MHFIFFIDSTTRSSWFEHEVHHWGHSLGLFWDEKFNLAEVHCSEIYANKIIERTMNSIQLLYDTKILSKK